MKMTLELTLDEAIRLIKEYKTEVDEVIITDSINPYVLGIKAMLAAFPREFVNGKMSAISTKKIEAIKFLRGQVLGLGLAEAKVAVETPELALNEFAKTGKYLAYQY